MHHLALLVYFIKTYDWEELDNINEIISNGKNNVILIQIGIKAGPILTHNYRGVSAKKNGPRA